MCHYKNHRSRKESKSEVKGVVGYENNDKSSYATALAFNENDKNSLIQQKVDP